ncbi:hypothetical protein [Candidatus Kuenenia stuttgartiensis]|uniref:hypothetical protein n=1 Tax=Kuenenia stuttgartiensis TaxID=174633 RepID=UPI00146BFDB8|nr:hypothetical protein [Candidatus Kuenenia stuttgartiensis]
MKYDMPWNMNSHCSFASPVRRIKEFDRENVVCYISISNDREKLFEDKATWLDIETNEIPGGTIRTIPLIQTTG